MKQYVVTITGTCAFPPKRTTWDTTDLVYAFLWKRFSLNRDHITLIGVRPTWDGWYIKFIDHLPWLKEEWYREVLLGNGAERAEIEIRGE